MTPLRLVDELRARVDEWKASGQRIGLVPTMGALHAGHLSLVHAARAECDRVIVTIFVNPRQFNNAADLSRYPRTEAADLALLQGTGVDAVFVPPVEQVYPPGFVTQVSVGGVAAPLEGADRPGHFDGVATVVTKLLGMSRADRAYFGQKDWQQLQVVRQVVRDLNLPVQIVGCQTLRDPDGLAMSSRNTRLSPADRARAAALPRLLDQAAAALAAGESDALDRARAGLLQAGFERVDYLVLRDGETLGPARPDSRDLRLLAAAWLGGVRLIDNIPVAHPASLALATSEGHD